VREHGSIEGMPAPVREPVEPVLHAIRELYLNPPVSREVEIHFGSCDRAGVVRFLCDEREFSRARVEAALERAFPPGAHRP